MLEKCATVALALLLAPPWANAGPKKADAQKNQQQLLARQAAAKAAENQQNASKKLAQKAAAAHQAAVTAQNNAKAQEALNRQSQHQQGKREPQATSEQGSSLSSTEIQEDSD